MKLSNLIFWRSPKVATWHALLCPHCGAAYRVGEDASISTWELVTEAMGLRPTGGYANTLKGRDDSIGRTDVEAVSVDDLEVAQFIYLMLNNEKIRNVLTTIGNKGVLLLGRFSPERKAVLDALRNSLRRLNYVLMMFDFQNSTDRTFTEIIRTLAGLSRFIIADVTNPRSAPLELQATVPDYMVPVGSYLRRRGGTFFDARGPTTL
jgi:hypothetical protein